MSGFSQEKLLIFLATLNNTTDSKDVLKRMQKINFIRSRVTPKDSQKNNLQVPGRQKAKPDLLNATNKKAVAIPEGEKINNQSVIWKEIWKERDSMKF